MKKEKITKKTIKRKNRSSVSGYFVIPKEEGVEIWSFVLIMHFSVARFLFRWNLDGINRK